MLFKRFTKLMEDIRHTKMKRSVFLIFSISYIIILLLSMTSNVIYYQRMEKNTLENIKRSSFAMLEQLQIDMDNKLRQVYELSNNIVFDKKLAILIKGNDYIFSYKDIMEDMMNYPKNEFIYDYYIYFYNTDQVVTATVKFPSQRFYDIMYSYEGVEYSSWQDEVLSKYHFHTYLPSRQLNAYNSEKHRVITFVQSIPINRSDRPLGQLIILIDEEKISGMIDKMHWAAGAYIYIIDKNGETILTSKEAPLLPNEIKKQISLSSSIFDYSMGRDEVTVLCHTSEQNNWKYVMVMPKSIFLAEINRTKTFTLSLSLFCLILGVGLAFLFAYHNYRPIKEIRDMVMQDDNGTQKQFQNELDYIKSSVIHTLEHQDRLNDFISMQLPIMRSEYLGKLLKGYAGDIDMDEDTLKFMQLEFVSDEFLVLMAEISENSSFFTSLTEKEWVLARFVLENIGSEIIDKSYKQQFVELQRNRVAFIVNLPQDTKPEVANNEIRQVVTLFMHVLCDKCNMIVTLGISEIHKGIFKIRECYDEALKSLEHSRLLGKGNAIFLKSLPSRMIIIIQ